MFDNRLKLLREAKGISMKQAAAEMGFPYTTYINYEKNINEPNSDVLVKLAIYYNTTVDYLLGRAPVDGNVSPPISPVRKALQDKLESLSLKDLEEIDKFMDYLIWKEEQG